jgi:hypothetical protein
LAKKAATELVKDEDFADLRQFMAGDFAQMQASTLDGQALEKTVKAWGTIQAERTKLLGGWPAQVAAVVALRKERDNASNTFIEKLAKREIKAAGLGEYRAAQAARDQKTEAAINDAFVTLKQLKALDDLERALPLPSWSVPPRLKLFAQCVQGPLEIEQFYAGVPTVVEVAFDAPQREGRCEVTIEVGGAKLKLTARRDAAEPRRFVSETFVPGADADAIKKEDAFDPPVRPKPEKENP